MSEERVGIVASCFDLFHAGHVLMLMEARENCDRLVVALQSDPTIDRIDVFCQKSNHLLIPK